MTVNMSAFTAAVAAFGTALNGSLATINSENAAAIPQSLIPVSRFGALTATGINYTTTPASNLLSIAAGVPLLLSGQNFTMPAGALTYTSNATNFIYAQLVSGMVQYAISTTALAESVTNMYVGELVAGASGAVTSITLVPVSRLDTYRISTSEQGASIAVSGGTPNETNQHLLWS